MTIGNPARPIQLLVDGVRREVNVRRLTDQDLTEITEWLRFEYVKTARGGLEGMPRDDFDRLYLAAVRDSMEVSIVSDKGRKMLATHAGLARVMWHALRTDQPDLTPANVLNYMTSAENVRAANDYVRSMADPTRPPGRAGGPRPSRGSKSTKGSRRPTTGRSARSRK